MNQNITLDGHRLAYSTAGDPEAPPVMMLHGWMLCELVY
jgi:pimeloyl-ACP methyl ester carboxylesterase